MNRITWNAETKRRWIEALESGEYVKGGGDLCWEREDGVCEWCCLGVLIDVAWDGDWVRGKRMVDRWGIHYSDGYVCTDVGRRVMPESWDRTVLDQLMHTNDDSTHPDFRDVLPIIRAMEVDQ